MRCRSRADKVAAFAPTVAVSSCAAQQRGDGGSSGNSSLFGLLGDTALSLGWAEISASPRGEYGEAAWGTTKVRGLTAKLRGVRG